MAIQTHPLAKPSQQLHAIWYLRPCGSTHPRASTHVDSYRLCIPTDNDRPSGFLPSGFLSKPIASGILISRYSTLSVMYCATYPFSGCYRDFHQVGWKTVEVMDAVLGANPSPTDYIHPPLEVELKVAEFINGLCLSGLESSDNFMPGVRSQYTFCKHPMC